MEVPNDLVALAHAVDDRVRALPPGCDPARLFGVRRRLDGFVLVPFWSGVARGIPPSLAPPKGCTAIALETSGWAAPHDDDVTVPTRPSEHPDRWRIHATTVVADDGDAVTVLRDEDARDAPPTVLHGGVGTVPNRLRACWARRPDAA